MELEKKIAELGAKLDAVYASVEKTRKYFYWVLVITVAMVVLPAIGLLFAIPKFISVYTTGLGL